MCKKLQLLGLRPQTIYRGFAPGHNWGISVPEPPNWLMFILGLSGGISPSSPQKKFRNPPKTNSTRLKNQRHEVMAGRH